MSRDFESSNDDYIEVGDVPALDLTGDEITLMAWVRLEALNGEMKVFAKWRDSGGALHQYLLSISAADKVLFAVDAGGQSIATGTTSFVADTWYHIVGTYDGSDIRVYFDGVEEDSVARAGNFASTIAPVRIGAGSGGAGTEQPFDGEIGHCAIWDVGISAGEIESLANGFSPLQVRPDNLLFYAPLNGLTPEYDAVGGLSLTVNGPVASEEPPGLHRPLIAVP